MLQKDLSPFALKIHALLPQTQCQRCGFEDCAAYAQSIADEHTPINQCPPGGDEGVARLATLTGQAPQPINPAHGAAQERTAAFIDEDWCIGCTLCIKACPVGCIIGASKMMHTVIESQCTGCELCIPACPVDCIEIEITTPGQTGWAAWSQSMADDALNRYENMSCSRTFYAANQSKAHQKNLQNKPQALQNQPEPHSHIQDPAESEKKRHFVQAALEKAKARAHKKSI